MIKPKIIIRSKICLACMAVILTIYLLGSRPSSSFQESVIFVIDLSPSMSTQDIATSVKGEYITRLDAAKKIIQKIVTEYPQRSFGLITYSSKIEYVIPPTSDSGVLLQYSNSFVIGMRNEEVGIRNVGTWSTGLVAALQDKNIIVLGNVNLPKSLVKNTQIIPLATYKTFQPSNFSTLQHFNVSTTQTQLLVVLLCLLVILSL